MRLGLVVRWLRCGKPGCHCAQGEGHRATYFCVTLSGGKTEQISLPAELLPQVERGIATYHAWWAAVEELSALNREEIRRQRQAPPATSTVSRRPSI